MVIIARNLATKIAEAATDWTPNRGSPLQDFLHEEVVKRPVEGPPPSPRSALAKTVPAMAELKARCKEISRLCVETEIAKAMQLQLRDYVNSLRGGGGCYSLLPPNESPPLGAGHSSATAPSGDPFLVQLGRYLYLGRIGEPFPVS